MDGGTYAETEIVLSFRPGFELPEAIGAGHIFSSSDGLAFVNRGRIYLNKIDKEVTFVGQALIKGSKYNVAANTITWCDLPFVERVSNPNPAVGGTDGICPHCGK
jgi:hypothetical protein